MKNARKQPQRVPPPLLAGDERIEGQGILEDFPGEHGLVLWKTYRSVRLWAELSPSERRELMSCGAYDARVDHVRRVPELEEIRAPLLGLAEIYRRTVTRTMVVSRCHAIEAWAESHGGARTALEFGQLAALAAPANAEAAVRVAKRGRDLAEYARAESWYWQGIVRARRAKNWEAYVFAMLGLGLTHMHRGNYPAARRSLDRGLKRSRRQGLLAHEAMALHELTVLAIRSDNLRRTVEYARQTLQAYGPRHPRLPALSHDLAVFWMIRGYFAQALEVFLAIPDDFGSPADRLAHASSIARAAGAVGDERNFDDAVARAEALLEEPLARSRAARALVDIARGALSLGDLEHAARAAQRALDLATARAEAEDAHEAEGVLQEARASRAVRAAAPVVAPAPVEDLTAALVASMAAAPASP